MGRIQIERRDGIPKMTEKKTEKMKRKTPDVKDQKKLYKTQASIQHLSSTGYIVTAALLGTLHTYLIQTGLPVASS